MYWLMILNMVDAVVTVFAVRGGFGLEANPLFTGLNSGEGLFFFVGAKLFISAFLLLSIVHLWRDFLKINNFFRKAYLFGSGFVLLVLVLVIVNNLAVIIF